MKQITLIRHAESLGQTARDRGLNRAKDPSLIDCFLTQKGIYQAFSLQPTISALHERDEFDLIVVSPLTRAVATCTIAFGHLYAQEQQEQQKDEKDSAASGEQQIKMLPPIICHPDIAEIGSRITIPECQARAIKDVKKSIKYELSHYLANAEEFVESIDYELLPKTWPKTKDRGMVAYFMEWLNQRTESNIAVVCHYNVILALLRHQGVQNVDNCVPIKCFMIDDDLRNLYMETHIDQKQHTETKSNVNKTAKKKGNELKKKKKN